MKQVKFPGFFSVAVLRIAICALLLGGAQLSLGADGGRLVIKRSPTLGTYVSVTVRIDDKLAGLLTRGRTFETHLAPGSHQLSASSGQGRSPWHGTLNVRTGETYTYTASLSASELVLTPATTSR
jgi:hypothetical protein